MSDHVPMGFKPYTHQKAAHLARLAFRFLVLVWHRRAGKTVFAVMELLLAAAACSRERGRYGYIAPLLKQAKAAAWDYLKHYARAIPGCVINESELQVELPNGARLRLFGADNPDSLRGMYFDGVVLDEVADMRPEVWGEIVRPALADRQGWAIFLGTPKGVNLFSELFFRAQSEDGWKADLRRASDTGVIPAEEIEKARREMSVAQFAQEFDCDFQAAVDDVLLTLGDVQAAQKRNIAVADYTHDAKALGIDVARYGTDRTVIVKRQGLASFTPKTLRGASVSETISHANHIIHEWQPDGIFVDGGGVGGGVVDGLRTLGHEVTEVQFGGRPIDERFANKRAEMWWVMADWIKRGGAIPDIQEYTQDLTAPRYTYRNAQGRLQLESKDDMRARGMPSPDLGDALACTFAEPLSPRNMRPQRKQTVHDYDPYAAADQAATPRVVTDYDPLGVSL